MKGWISGVAVVLLAMTPAYAQQQQTEVDQAKARQRISTMEGVLERAVTNGADNMLRQIKAVTSDPPVLTGQPEVRGFRLDGYGVFFDVEVPQLLLPVTWPLRQLYRDNTNRVVDDLRALMVNLNPPQREQVAQLVQRLQLQAPVSQQVAGQGPSAQVPRQPDPVVDDPEARYTLEVKSALVDAMIENSQALAIGLDEWLTVAARDNVQVDPLIRGDRAEFSTIIFRVKGSDLSAFRAGRITIDDVRKKVEVREY
jgi:hypothetical protein